MDYGGDLHWYRGQLHMHTYWSDGRGFPEQAIAAYRQRGYDFISITDHNRFASDVAKWRRVEDEEGGWPPEVARAIYQDLLRDFGHQQVQTRRDASGTLVRLSTYAELRAAFEEPGRFLLWPGVEITQKLGTNDVHLNYLNLPALLPSLADASLVQTVTDVEDVRALIARNMAETARLAEQLGKPCLLMLNHPFWRFHDVLPNDLIDFPELRFFEICNNGTDFPPHASWGDHPLDKFWDVVNAFRLQRGLPPLYGIGSDDAHFYDADRIDGKNGVALAWIMVRAARLETSELIQAMQHGDFYATTGIVFDELAYDPAERTLRVRIRPEAGVNYRLHIITTRRGFDERVSYVDIPAEPPRPARRLPIYSSEIGQVVESIAGCEATYRLRDDDLYVRIRAESDIPSRIQVPLHPTVQTAWTQPYTLP